MYPRLRLAYDLLSEDGVIFISIDDNEQANLKLLCDDIFGEDNRLDTFNIQVRYADKSLNEKDNFQKLMEYVLIYAKNRHLFVPKKPSEEYDLSKFCYKITELDKGKEIELGNKKVCVFNSGQYKVEKVKNFGVGYLKATWASGSVLKGNTSGKFFDRYLSKRKDIDGINTLYKVYNIGEDGLNYRYFTGPKKKSATQGLFYSGVPLDRLEQIKKGNAIKYSPIINYYDYSADFGNIKHEGGVGFNRGKKPVKMLKNIIKISNLQKNDIVLDFFAGSGTTGHAVMELNAEDECNRKFILCQLDEEIREEKNKEAFDFCKENNFPTVISSITCERLNRSGQQTKQKFGEKAKDLDIGYKVFDLIDGEKLTLKQEELEIENQNNLNSIDKIYNLIFKVGVDNPTIQPKEIIKDCMYLCENKNIKNYYIVNSKNLDVIENKKIFKQAIDTGNIYIDGWTATINTTLQENKDTIKIIF